MTLKIKVPRIQQSDDNIQMLQVSDIFRPGFRTILPTDTVHKEKPEEKNVFVGFYVFFVCLNTCLFPSPLFYDLSNYKIYFYNRHLKEEQSYKLPRC